MADNGPGATEWDFFVSYTRADQEWAEWIAWHLEAAGYSVLIQAWDFVPGTNWIKRMQDGVSRSARVIIVLSPAYIGSLFGTAEWQAVWAHDPDGAKRRIIPMRIADCERPGLLMGIVGIDLFGIPEPEMTMRLQSAVQSALAGRAKPLSPPSLPTEAEDTTYAKVQGKFEQSVPTPKNTCIWIVQANPVLWLRSGPGFCHETVGSLCYGQRVAGNCVGVESGGTIWHLLRIDSSSWAWGNGAYLQSQSHVTKPACLDIRPSEPEA